MIIDYTQNKENVSVSFVNDLKQIELVNVPLKYGYYKYIKAESWEINEIVKDLKSFKYGSYIKREATKYFGNHNINEFLNYEIKQEYPEIYNNLSALNIPNPFSIDIETEITDKYGYSSPEKAENRILSMSITDINLNTLLFEVKNPDKPECNDLDKIYIDSIIKDSLKHLANDYEYKFEIRTFDNEIEMLNTFLECMNKYFHSIFGWNFEFFDWIYIINRCKNLGINIAKASPTNKVIKKNIKIKKDKNNAANEVSIALHKPAHRIIIDYMHLFKTSLIYNNLGSYSLNSIAGEILKLNKVMFDGNLRTLYNSDYNKFRAYAIIDTILVMLIHKKTYLYDIDFFEAYVNGIAFAKISQNSISEALVYNKLRSKNIFLLESEFNIAQKQSFPGGYVKTPVKKISEAVMGEDFSGLYPNTMITLGLSPEQIIDVIETNEFGMPKTKEAEEKWLAYKQQNCILAPTGTVYNKEEGLFTEIEKDLIAKRKIFKGHVEECYLTLSKKIDDRIKQLKQLNTKQ